jgi:class 3 adenylate cyclase
MNTEGRVRAERRLAAILAADVAGYSRLIGVDEEGTLHRIRSIRAELIDPKIAEHHGRLVKTTGDGLLVEFGSVVDALRCAVEIQQDMAERNAGIEVAERIDFRIGIHQGDIVVEDGDIFGDGVNVAARLEGLAEPGGICVSARVQEDTAGRLDIAFADMGEQSLKNIARPVRAYRISIQPRPVDVADGSAADWPVGMARGPLEIIFDRANPHNKFWSMESPRDEDGKKLPGVIWEYRIEIRNNSSRTIRNVMVTAEHIGAMPIRPYDRVFDKNRKTTCDLRPHCSELATVLWWPIPIRQAGMAFGEDVYGPIKITVGGDDVLPTVRIFRFDYEATPMLMDYP